MLSCIDRNVLNVCCPLVLVTISLDDIIAFIDSRIDDGAKSLSDPSALRKVSPPLVAVVVVEEEIPGVEGRLETFSFSCANKVSKSDVTFGTSSILNSKFLSSIRAAFENSMQLFILILLMFL